MTNIILEAELFAQLAHKGQKDDTGKDYFEAHIKQVATIVKQITSDEIMIATAYLHDVIEDTPVTPIELSQKFGPEITSLVLELTHEGKKDNAGYYFPRLKTRRAILIKFADRLSNLSRMEAWNEKRKKQYIKKSKFWASEPNKIV